MKKIKKSIAIFLCLGIIFSFSGIVYGRNGNNIPTSSNLDDLIGMAAKLYNTEDIVVSIDDAIGIEYDEINSISNATSSNATSSNATSSNATLSNTTYKAISSDNDVGELFIAQEDVSIEHNGISEFVDAIWYDGEEYFNVSSIANWYSEDPDIVIAEQGRLLATGQGNTKVTVEYKGNTFCILVRVIEEVDMMKSLESLANKTRTTISSERDEILDRGLEMINVTWTPANSVRGWRNKITYEAGTTYTGIPYSQTAHQTNYSTFVSKVSASDFCDDYTRTLSGETIIMPKYGNDCSGFVSFSWNIARNTTASFISGITNGTFYKVGEYNTSNPTESSLLAAYELLQPGDAIVKSGHVILVYASDSSTQTLYCYEQTPYYAQITQHSYSSCASSGYMPFTNLTSGWVTENGITYYYQDGVKATGWLQISSEWYYFEADGAMKTGWYQEGDVYYYLHSDGIMAHSEWIQDPETNYWYYFHGSGNMATNEWIPKDGEWYYLKASGRMATNEWVDWTDVDGYWYWVQEDGTMFRSGSLTINGVTYQFDGEGRCLNP